MFEYLFKIIFDILGYGLYLYKISQGLNLKTETCEKNWFSI